MRTYEFARRFCMRGASVDVVCGAGYDPSLQTAGSGAVDVGQGFRVFVSGTPYRPHMGFVCRVASFLTFMAECLWFVIRRGRVYDVVVASSGPLTLAVPALVGRWLWRTPFVFEVIDVWPDSAIEAGVLKSPVLKSLSFWVERLAYAWSAAIVTCSTGMTERVTGKIERRSVETQKCESSKVITISNCCDMSLFTLDGAMRKSIRVRYGLCEEQTVVLYTGAMGISNAVDDLLQAMRETSAGDGVVWWFVGDGPRGEDIRRALSESRHGQFFGSIPKQELVELYLAADINVVSFMHASLFYENSPNKFFDGIAAGLPAVFNRSTWLEPWLKEYDCGVVCKGERPGEELADAIRALAGDPERRKRMGRNARRLAEEVFDRDKLANEYLAVLEDVLKCGSPKTREKGDNRE